MERRRCASFLIPTGSLGEVAAREPRKASGSSACPAADKAEPGLKRFATPLTRGSQLSSPLDPAAAAQPALTRTIAASDATNPTLCSAFQRSFRKARASTTVAAG